MASMLVSHNIYMLFQVSMKLTLYLCVRITVSPLLTNPVTVLVGTLCFWADVTTCNTKDRYRRHDSVGMVNEK
jgi:hypothetical protein